MVLQDNTPTERFSYNGKEYYVKREDMACIAPGPPFAKIRGLILHLQSLKDRGVQTVGYMDTSISMAGWGISYLCLKLNMRAVIYYPKYKNELHHNQSEYIPKWAELGATIIPIDKPTKLQINIHLAKRDFAKQYPNGVWLEYGLRLKETVLAVEQESIPTLQTISPGSIVISVGSGVMLSGVIRGIAACRILPSCIYGILVNTKVDVAKKRRDILRFAEMYDDLFTPLGYPLYLITKGYRYEEKAKITSPFPCNPYYDLKAYEWLTENINELKTPVLFWNIGG